MSRRRDEPPAAGHGADRANPLGLSSAADWRAWLGANHASARELWLRLRRSGAAGPGVMYAEALDQALCFGWIDGIPVNTRMQVPIVFKLDRPTGAPPPVAGH